MAKTKEKPQKPVKPKTSKPSTETIEPPIKPPIVP